VRDGRELRVFFSENSVISPGTEPPGRCVARKF
jgi:hypothetical protein